MAVRRFRRFSRVMRRNPVRPTWGSTAFRVAVQAANFNAIILQDVQTWQASAGFRAATFLGGILMIDAADDETLVVSTKLIRWYVGLFNEGENIPPPLEPALNQENILAVGQGYVGNSAGSRIMFHREHIVRAKRKLDTNSIIVLAVGNTVVQAGTGAEGNAHVSVTWRGLVRGT